MICTKTKDLELGLYLTEASARVHGFDGLRDGLWMLGGLIKGFFHGGLQPEPTEGDLGDQFSKLYWLNEKLPDVICEIPLTRSPVPGANYSLNYFRESRRQDGLITSAEFDAAAAAGTQKDYDSLVSSIREARCELARFKLIATEAYGDDTSSFSVTEDTLDESLGVIESVLRKREGKNAPPTSPRQVGGPVDRGVQQLPDLSSDTRTSPGDSWSECERMARNGNVDGALSTMTALAASEPNGRVRFQRKLLLADLCLQSNRKKLAASILEELNEIIEAHKLESWETSEIVGGVWSRLVRCYRDRAGGTSDKSREIEFFAKLSRLDPWQALACGEPAKEDQP